MSEHDVVVIGGGLAGLTAALFAARLGRTTLVLNSGLPGGQLLNIGKIEDFPGFPTGVIGYELCPAVQEQALEAGATFEMWEAKGLERADHRWLVHTTGEELSAGSVIVATGSRPKALGIPGEEQFSGMGVSHCASCDGPLFRDRTVGVVGGGDSALQEALELTIHVPKVILFHRGDSFSGQDNYEKRVLSSPQIEVRFHHVLEEVTGQGSVSGVRVLDTSSGERSEVELGGLFVYVGGAPQTQFLGDLVSVDHHGRIFTDSWMRTDLEGLLAAGDIRADSAAQAVTVAGDGATAAIAAHRYLTSGVWKTVPAAAGA
jgi:thioredoxin reductase (NADPH)